MEILVNGSTIISRTGSCQSQMKRTIVNLDQYRGQTAKVKLIDYGVEHWGHITFDDLRHGVPCEGNHFLFSVIWYLLRSHNVMAKRVSITVFQSSLSCTENLLSFKRRFHQIQWRGNHTHYFRRN